MTSEQIHAYVRGLYDAVPCDECKVPGYYWWLPQSAECLDDWSITFFHPDMKSSDPLQGTFVGPLTPPFIKTP